MLSAAWASLELVGMGSPALMWAIRVCLGGMLLVICMAWRWTGVVQTLQVHVKIATAAPPALAALPASRTVEELLGGAFARQLSSKERHERTLGIIRAAGLSEADDVAALRISQLSTEQRRVVQILHCLAARPEVLVLDGALEGLPICTQARILRMVKRMKQECKTSVLCMSSELEQAAYLADSLAVLSPGGALWEKGPAHEVLQTPRHPDVKEFVGSSAASLPGADKGAADAAGGGESLRSRCEALLGDRALEGAWLPPIYN